MAEGNGSNVSARIDARLAAILVAIVSIMIVIIGSLVLIIYDNVNNDIKQNKDYYVDQNKQIREDAKNLAVDISAIRAKLGEVDKKVEVIATTINRDREGDDGQRDGKSRSRGLR
jgi:peptidoglycan hydrolase CwlO-like protein